MKKWTQRAFAVISDIPGIKDSPPLLHNLCISRMDADFQKDHSMDNCGHVSHLVDNLRIVPCIVEFDSDEVVT